MREIDVSRITDAVERMCISSNQRIPPDVKKALNLARRREDGPIARTILDRMMENAELALSTHVPVCQDTGMACVFLEIGQEVHFTGGNLYDAVNEGVRRGYTGGYLRKSVEADPVRRGNTGDNTPAMITMDLVPGDRVKLTVAPKGFGSENMSALKMLKPAEGVEGIVEFILKTVEEAGPNPCPPVIVGVGIGGNFDHVALLAKKALLRPVDVRNPDPYYAALEEDLLERINTLGIGPQGFGGRTTALGANIETLPTHIAGMPCAVNLSCHVTRHETEVI